MGLKSLGLAAFVVTQHNAFFHSTQLHIESTDCIVIRFIKVISEMDGQLGQMIYVQ